MTSTSPVPANEADRLARLQGLLVLDSAPEALFDGLAKLASEVCGVPIALLSLIDAERQWFKANVGLPGVNQTARDVAFCAHAITDDALLQVPDATRDARFAANPLVTGAPDIRFYAGAPVVLQDGARVGTLCVIDRTPRKLSPAQAAMLVSLARIASQALEMRRDLITRSLAVRSDHEIALAESDARHRALVDDQSELVSQADADGTLIYVNPAYARHFGTTAAALIGTSLYDLVHAAERPAVRAQIQHIVQTGERRSSVNRVPTATGGDGWVAWTSSRQFDAQGRPMLHSVGRDVSDHKQAEVALRASEAFLARTGRVAGVGGWELDLTNGRLDWSEQTRRIHDVGAEFVPQLETALQFYAPEARPLIEEAVRLGIEQARPWDLELQLITATGRRIWARVAGEVEHEDGKPVRLIGAFQDISDRKRLEQQLADNERFVHKITDSLPVRIAYVDSALRYRFVNQAHCNRFGLPREQIIGRRRGELLPGGNSAEMQAAMHGVLTGARQRVEFDETVDGERRRFESVMLPDADDDGAVRGFFATGIDITDRVAQQQALQRESATLQSVAEAIPAMVSVVDNALRYRFANGAFERWHGVPREGIVGSPMAQVLSAADAARSRPFALRALAGETVQFERAYPDRAGTPHIAVSYVPLRLSDGSIDGFVGVAQDITHHRLEQVRLLQLSQRDPLTGLLNRAGLQAWLEESLQHGAGASLALLCIDLDHFKPVNDNHGHPVGDQVLQVFAQRLSHLVRPTDAVARLGGDEFAVLLAGVREGAHAQVVADKVVAAGDAPFHVGALCLNVGASVGVALGADAATGWQGLLARADAMLYRAKAAGRGQQAGAAVTPLD